MVRTEGPAAAAISVPTVIEAVVEAGETAPDKVAGAMADEIVGDPARTVPAMATAGPASGTSGPSEAHSIRHRGAICRGG